MTDHQDQLDILIERAIDGRLLDSEGPELRSAVRALRDQAEQAAAERSRYRDAWYSARIRAQANTPPPDGPCRVVDVDGTPVRVAGAAAFTPEGRAAFAEVVRAAQRRYAAEHSDSPSPTH